MQISHSSNIVTHQSCRAVASNPNRYERLRNRYVNGNNKSQMTIRNTGNGKKVKEKLQ